MKSVLRGRPLFLPGSNTALQFRSNEMRDLFKEVDKARANKTPFTEIYGKKGLHKQTFFKYLRFRALLEPQIRNEKGASIETDAPGPLDGQTQIHDATPLEAHKQ